MGDKKEVGVPPVEVLLAPPTGDEPQPVPSTTNDANNAVPKTGGEGQVITPTRKEDTTGHKSGGDTDNGTPTPTDKHRSKTTAATKREMRLQKVMKPLTDKCIPDKDPKIVKDSKYMAPPRQARPPGQVRAKDEVLRRSSKLVFTMPFVREPAVIEALKTDTMVHKLIKYMKKSWCVRVDPRQEERDLVYRTVEAVHTKHADNWEELREEREQLIDKRGESSKQRGFFCGYDANYPFIYTLELDTPLHVLHNLPPDLKITDDRWLRMKALKEERKRKRDAFLPRLPNNQFKRPNFARGKIIKDLGGLNAVDELLKLAEKCQKSCKVSKGGL